MFQKTHSHKIRGLTCGCGAHCISLSFFPEDEHEKWGAYLTVEIVKLPFWSRLKWGLKIILGKTRDWEEFVIENEYAWKNFKAMIDEIDKELGTSERGDAKCWIQTQS